MYPYAAFPGRRVKKEKGHGKGRRGTVIEVNLCAGVMLIEFDDTRLRHWVNPHEYKSLPDKESA